MLRGMASADINDSRVRQLLEERRGRSEALRVSTYSESSESASSVYSRPFFSPRQTDKLDDHTFRSPTLKLTSQRRLLEDPSSSVLDFDEDVRASMALDEAYALQHDPDDDSDRDSLPRMSYLGPKMRFHSRAPWELEQDTLEEVDETESNGHGGFMGMLRGKGPKADLSPSPRPSTATTTGRPSAESSRSFLNSKRSFDTSTSSITHPRGALYALAQESLSTSSLGRPPHPGAQDGLRGKFSLGRLRSHSSTVDIPSSPDASATRLPQNGHSTIAPPSPRASCDTTNSSTLDVQTGLNALFVDRRINKGFHPYASPDVVSYSTEPPLKSPIHTILPYPEVPRKDSNATVVELSSFTAPVKPLTKSAPTPETLKRRVSHIQGKDISGPVSMLSPESPTRPQFDEPLSVPPTTHSIPGWTERSNINPGFSLISLEEARAQRRTATLPQTHESTSSGDSSTTTAIETSTTDVNHPDLAAARARARSISAGTKAKNALSSFVWQPERRGSENGLVTGGQPSAAKDANATPAAGKSIKHKKSGFMRLFSNGKANEKESPPVPQPPSVPSLPQSEAPAFIPRHNPKLSSHRIPVPSLSPSLLEAAAQYDSNQELTDLVIDVSPSRTTLNPRRTPPHALSINTKSSPLSASPRGHLAGFSKQDGAPQSAPPNVGDFPPLKLRPVSTLFSAHFGDHIDVTKLNFDELEDINPKETREDVLSARRQENERQRQDSLTSGSASSGPSSASAASFIDSQYNLSPIAPSFAGTALTTPTSGGIVSPTSSSTTGPWNRDREHAGLNISGRFSVDQQSPPPSLSISSANSASNASQHVVRETEETTTIRVLQEHLDNTNKMWQKRVWDLEGEVRVLKNELAEMKLLSKSSCEKCGGKGSGVPPVPPLPTLRPDGSILNRPRAKTGSSARFVNGQL